MAAVRCPKCGERIFGGGRKCPDCGYVRSMVDEVADHVNATVRVRHGMRPARVGNTDARKDLWAKKRQR